MNKNEAKQLAVGQRVRWVSNDYEFGTVTQNTGQHVGIRWDDEDFDRVYPVDGRASGLFHIQKIATLTKGGGRA